MSKKKKSLISPEVKRYLVSSGISFITAFAIAILPHIDSLTLENIGTGAGIAVLFAGLRAGVKVIVEGIASKAV